MLRIGICPIGYLIMQESGLNLIGLVPGTIVDWIGLERKGVDWKGLDWKELISKDRLEKNIIEKDLL